MKGSGLMIWILFFLMFSAKAQDSVEIEILDTTKYEFPLDYDSTALVWKDTFKMDTSYIFKIDQAAPKLIISKRVYSNSSRIFILFLAVWMMCGAVVFSYAHYVSFVFSTMFNVSLVNQLVREKNIYIPIMIFVLGILTVFTFYFSFNIMEISKNLLLKLTLAFGVFIIAKYLLSRLVAAISEYKKEMNIALLYQIWMVGIVAFISTFFLSAYYFGFYFTVEMYKTFILTLLGIAVFFYSVALMRSYQFINTQFTVSFFLYLCTFEIMPLVILIVCMLHKIG